MKHTFQIWINHKGLCRIFLVSFFFIRQTNTLDNLSSSWANFFPLSTIFICHSLLFFSVVFQRHIQSKLFYFTQSQIIFYYYFRFYFLFKTCISIVCCFYFVARLCFSSSYYHISINISFIITDCVFLF